MSYPNPKNQKENKRWIKNSINHLYTLEGTSLIEKSQEFITKIKLMIEKMMHEEIDKIRRKFKLL